MSSLVVLSLGGNQGDVVSVFTKAIKSIEQKIGKIDKKSSLYKTKAWGVENQPDFVNQVIGVYTQIAPNEVLEICLAIESELGRVRHEKWGERVIDIDLLLYENQVINTNNLIVPHPYMHQRNFILYPLCDVYPTYKHPTINRTILELKHDCSDKLEVIQL